MTRDKLIHEARVWLSRWDRKTALPVSALIADVKAHHPSIEHQDFGDATFDEAVTRVLEFVLRYPNGPFPPRVGKITPELLAAEVRDKIREAYWFDERNLDVPGMVAVILKGHPNVRADLGPSFEDIVAETMIAEYENLGAALCAEADALAKYAHRHKAHQ